MGLKRRMKRFLKQMVQKTVQAKTATRMVTQMEMVQATRRRRKRTMTMKEVLKTLGQAG